MFLLTKRKKRELRRVLQWVNQERAEHNLNGAVGPAGQPLFSLPKGVPRNSSRCVIARALDGNSSSSGTRTNADGVWVLHPQFVREFIVAFDERQYPELIA